ncbi:MAG: hypothetical protein ABSF80_11740 [Chitinispirillaceae bacterium]|jgi:hypothetical protein
MHPEKPYVKNPVIKIMYASMLFEFSPAEMREFWDQHPLSIEGRILKGEALFRYLWDDNGYVPVAYMAELWRNIESFFVQKGRNFLEIYRNALLSMGSGIGFEARFTLWIFRNLLKYFFGNGDFYKGLFRAVPAANRQVAPGLYLGPAGFADAGNGRNSALMISAPDETFSKNIPPHDVEFHLAQIAQLAPIRFGFPPCERYEVKADLRPATEIIDPSLNPRTENGIFYIQEEPFGREIMFFDYMKERKYGFGPLKPPDSRVVLVDKDFYCPARKRIVLVKGAVYGAPVFLYTVIYRPKPMRMSPEAMLSSLSDDIMHSTRSRWAEAERRYQELLRSFTMPIKAEYRSGREEIFVSGRFITSGAQAKMLRRMFRAFAEEGRTRFERREFVSDEEVISDRLNPSFSLRLRRIIEALDKAGCGVRIEKSGRGKIQLHSDASIDITEK